MRSAAAFIRNTAIGGVLFLLPVAVVAFLVGQLIAVLQPTAAKAAAWIGHYEMSPVWLTMAIVIGLLMLAFFSGLLAGTAAGRAIVSRLDALILDRLPGYGVIRDASADAASSIAEIGASEQRKAVLVRSQDAAWQIGFLMEQVSGQLYAVFVPNAPSPHSGSVVFVSPDRIADSGISASDALAYLRRLGARPPKFLVPALEGAEEGRRS